MILEKAFYSLVLELEVDGSSLQKPPGKVSRELLSIALVCRFKSELYGLYGQENIHPP